MKKKLFTLLTLMVLCVTGAWAEEVLFHWQSSGSSSKVETATNATVGTYIFTGSANPGTESATYAEGVASDMKSTNSKANKLGTNTLYFQANLKSGEKLQAGDIIYVCGYKPYKIGKTVSSNTAGTEISSSLTTGSSKTDYKVGQVVVTAAMISGGDVTSVYFSRAEGTGTGLAAIKIVRPGAGAPVFNPISGSSVAEGSKIAITSSNSTSIKYKWTNSTETPTDGWSDYDADEKVMVPSASDGTPYLHAQGFKGGDAGTAGYAQYTITAPDTDAPTLESQTPAADATNQAISGNIVLTFNEIIVCTTKATLTPEGGEAVELNPTVSGTTVTYAYTELAYNKAYTFNLAANSVADGSGNKYASAINFSFTTVQEICATPTITVYGNKVVKIACTTEDATIYYGGSDVKTGTKTAYTGMFIPAANSTIYAYAVKAGAIDSELASQAITLPVVGNVVGDLMMTLQPGATPSSDTSYGDSKTFTKAGYTLASDKDLLNSAMNGYPCNFKANVNTATFTITPPDDVTIRSIKIYGTSNDNSKTTDVTAGTGGTIISTYSKLMPRNIFIGDNVEMSEVVMTVDNPSAGTAVTVKLGGSASQARFYVEVYGATSATVEGITPAKTYTTYVPTHNLDFTSTNKLTAFIATSATASTVTMTSVDKVPAGTPIVVKATETGSAINVNVTTTTDDVSANLLKAGDGTTSIGGTSKYDYLLSDGKFYRAEEGTIAVGKAYLHLDAAPASAHELSIVFEGETTGIANLNVNDNANFDANAPMYNLAGQRVNKSYKGVVIVNGKKVLRK